MKLPKKLIPIFRCLLIVAISINTSSCESEINDPEIPEVPEIPEPPEQTEDFPDFITPIDKYFVLNIAGNHQIDGDSYRLNVSGNIHNPREYTLEELRNLDMFEKTLTIECIDNPPNGTLLGTASWKGFNVYKLLQDLGIKEGSTFVKYICSDGYFTYNTLEELQNEEVLGALYMNDEILPEKFGFPLRILFPGFYGVRQPGWVMEMEVRQSGVKDFWSETQFEKWKTDSAIAIDSKIFFPGKNDTLYLGEEFKIGGAAYGAKRISSVEVTVDEGDSWIPATITQSIDQDNVWVFWEAVYIPQKTGALNIRARATGQDGRVQPRYESEYLDGYNSWPSVTILVGPSNL